MNKAISKKRTLIGCILAIFAISSVGISNSAFAKSRKHNSVNSSSRSKAVSGVWRDKHGRINRCSGARNYFMKKTGYPHGRKGYVVDHIIPLKRGGADLPSNMQWQTIEEAKAKDKIE